MPLLFPGLDQCYHKEMQRFIEVPCSAERDVKENIKCVPCRLQRQGAGLCGALEDTGRNVPGRGGQATNPCSSSAVHQEVRALPSSPDGQIWICLLQPPCSDKETDGCGTLQSKLSVV